MNTGRLSKDIFKGHLQADTKWKLTTALDDWDKRENVVLYKGDWVNIIVKTYLVATIIN